MQEEIREAPVEVSAAQEQMYAATAELRAFEQELIQRYATGKAGKDEGGFSNHDRRHSSVEHSGFALSLQQTLPAPRMLPGVPAYEVYGPRPHLQDHRRRKGRDVCTLMDDAPQLRPAALPLERVREIEKYRNRFAQHCLACREAGIYRGDPGDTASVATWTIWPHIADAIVMAVVEEAIEDVHKAMECH